MGGRGYASQQEAILAAQEDMRANFGPEIRFEAFGRYRKAPRTFRVLDSKGHHLDSFGVFSVGKGKWAWVEGTPRS